jgi:hypothetical protein
MYTAAAAHYEISPYLLASVHMQESRFSGQLVDPPAPAQGVASGVNSYGCCSGPMQFNMDAGVWEGHNQAFKPIASQRPATYPLHREKLPSCRGVPADQGCVYDDFDAIAGAAHKLAGDGADTSLTSDGTHDAVCAYIGACSEVDQCVANSPNQYCQVLPRAIRWERMGAEAATAETGGAIPASGGDLNWPSPAEFRSISSGFGMRWGRPHNGIDVPMPVGTPLGAAASGRVTLMCRNVTPCTGYGNFICLEHRPDLSTCYAHLSSFASGLRVGSTVARGDRIAYAGSTGASTGPHLHFEVRLGRYPDGDPVDPVPYLTGGDPRA